MQEEMNHLCDNCRKEVPESNWAMHEGFCRRNNRLCGNCGEVVRASDLAAHQAERHAPRPCDKCGDPVAPDAAERHAKQDCPRRQAVCPFCALPLEARELAEHESFCGSKTRPCELCGRLVKSREMDEHLVSGCRLPLASNSRAIVDSEDQLDALRARALGDSGPPAPVPPVPPQSTFAADFCATGTRGPIRRGGRGERGEEKKRPTPASESSPVRMRNERKKVPRE